MAGIRKIDAPKVQQPATTLLEDAQQRKQQKLRTLELHQILQKLFGNDGLPGNDLSKLPKLKEALEGAGDQKGEFIATIERRLEGPNLKVTSETLDALKAMGVDVTRGTEHLKALFKQQSGDLRTTEQLGQTADKTVADKVQGEAASTNALGAQQAILDSHKGAAVAKNELTPEFKLAKQLVGDVAGRIFSDKASPELKAIHHAIGPQVGALAQQTAMSVMSDPNAMANISSLFAKVGKEGFQAALASSTKEIAGHFLQTAGVQAKNPAAIQAALQGIEQMAPKLGSSLGPKIAETASKLGPRLLGEGAEVAAKAGAGAAAGAAGAAAGAAGAATKGAAATAAKAGGQALPVIGNIISVGSTLLAGANFIGQLMKKPHDFEKLMKEGINTLSQGIGIAFPWVGLGGTLVDAAWGAKVSVSDQKKQAAGIPVTENANIAEALPLLTDSAHVLQAALTGAGKHDAADKLGNLVATTKTMAHLDLNKPGDRLALLRKDEQQALVALAHESKGELEKLSGQETGPRKEALLKLASGFGALADTTLATLRFDKREQAPGFDDKANAAGKKDLETKRNEQAAHLLKALGDVGMAELLRRSEQSAPSA